MSDPRMAFPLLWMLEVAEARNADPQARTVTLKFSRRTLEMWCAAARQAITEGGEHRCPLPASIVDALNSGDGVYRP